MILRLKDIGSSSTVMAAQPPPQVRVHGQLGFQSNSRA